MGFSFKNFDTMIRSLFILALIVAVASAFVAPGNNAVAFARTATETKMSPVEVMDIVNDVASTSNLVATSASDFGGSYFPVIGLTCLGALILFLAPPLADE